MMEWTDRHCRYFLRLISKRALLYTEMVTSAAIVHGDRDHLLGFDHTEHPVALQLGGSNPAELAEAARIGEQFGYDEINLNCGCPSDRVQSGRFGACLMAEPQLVADCVSAMRAAVQVPVTVKCRIGIDDLDSYERLCYFVESIAAAGCQTIIIHARKAWLNGLSPKENREIPPLSYPTVYGIKRDFPQLNIVINGGIESLDQCQQHLQHVDGVMLGRAAYHNPWLLAGVDEQLFGDSPQARSRHDVLDAFLPYVDAQIKSGRRLCQISRHVLGLFQGCHGGRRFRRHLAEHGYAAQAGIEVLQAAAALVRDPHTQTPPTQEPPHVGQAEAAV